jgi:hypothetical protein
LEAAREELGSPFPQAQELEEKSARLAELDILLNMDNKNNGQPEQESESNQAEQKEPSEQEEESALELLEQENDANPPDPAFVPEVGQRVMFCPHEGQVKLTGEVIDVSDTTITLRSGRVTIPAIRDKGTFVEAPALDRTETLEYAQELALQHTGTDGEVFVAGGEGTYKGPVIAMTPTFAIQQTDNNAAVIHRLKDLAGKGDFQQGENISIYKNSSGVFISAAGQGEERNGNDQERSRYR